MRASIHTIWQQGLLVSSQDHHRVGASLFRIGTGLTILYQYLMTYYHRHFLYGPTGVVPYAVFVQRLHQTGSFSLYALDSAPIVFEGIFHVSIVVTVLWVLGWHTRLFTFLTWLCLWSLHQRNPILWDGGDNIVQIVLIYLCFANLGAVCSVDAGKQRSHGCRDPRMRQVVSHLHTMAALAVAIQLSLVYAAAGLYKVQGTLWQNGTALYYILRVGEFAWTGYGALLIPHGVLITVVTYGTVLFQVSFPFLFFFHHTTRRLALVVGICFHLGIGLVMGLMTFATFMISIELLFIPDRDYQMVWRALGGCRQQVGQWWHACQHWL